MPRANFKDANCELARFERVQAKAVFFGGARLRGAKLTDAKLRYATFTAADASAADFSGADLRDAVLGEVRAEAARFVRARLSRSNLSHADLRHANFTDADLSTANLHDVRDDHALWDGATVVGVKRTDGARLAAEKVVAAHETQRSFTVSRSARNLAIVSDVVSAAGTLGPAMVVRVEDGAVHVALADGSTARAELALALPYEPEVGDRLLVIGKDGDHYVIGVLRGRGCHRLTLQGDVDLHASDGRLRLTGDRGIELRSPEVEIHASRLEIVADTVREHFTSLCQRVSKLLSLHAGDAHTVVDGTHVTQAQTAAILTERTVTINGKEIHLG